MGTSLYGEFLRVATLITPFPPALSWRKLKSCRINSIRMSQSFCVEASVMAGARFFAAAGARASQTPRTTKTDGVANCGIFTKTQNSTITGDVDEILRVPLYFLRLSTICIDPAAILKFFRVKLSSRSENCGRTKNLWKFLFSEWTFISNGIH